jgi:hypothetical protein
MTEVTDEADATGIGGPHRESDAFDPIDDACVCAEHLPEFSMGSFSDVVEIVFPNRGKKGVGIDEFVKGAVAELEAEVVAIGESCAGKKRGEESAADGM